MRVADARGGTNRPGVPASAFSMPDGMRMRYDVPDSALAACVTGYAVYIADERTPMVNWYLPAPAMVTVLLDAGTVSASFRRHEYGELGQACVWGPTGHAFRTVTHGGIMVGIGLTAAGWARFTTRAADGYRDRVAPLSDFVGAAATARLVGALEALDDDADIAPLLDAVLPGLFAPDHAEEATIDALSRLILTDGVISVADVADRLGLDARALRRLATRHFGMTSKTLLTRARFIRSFTTWLMKGEPASYAGIDSSYFDVAHFLSEAHHYLDTTPRRFARRETDYLKASLRARSAVIGASSHALHATPATVPPPRHPHHPHAAEEGARSADAPREARRDPATRRGTARGG